ncbi:T9SS type A sorting domain-containing protein [bacterium]|nr:T9SS type A sorting domain-containing protein [bacterium]
MIWPNPFSNLLNVGMYNQQIDCITIYDMRGRLIHETNGLNTLYTIDTSQWERGVYVVCISTERGQFEMKIIKR